MVKKLFLQNNIPVLLETVREVRSLCVGVWVKVGARNEIPEKNGISHFLEHMFFKGTADRTAEDIAMQTDSLGAELNALTSSEYTLFYIKVLDEYVEKGVELMTDIFINSVFPEQDIEKEKSIINEEIKMVEDTPSDYVHELFSKQIWGETGLGQPVLGKSETIETFTRGDILKHINTHYSPGNIIVACSGNFSEDDFMGHLNSRLGRLKRDGKVMADARPEFRSGHQVITKDLSETHLCLGVQGLPYNSDKRYAMHLLNTILGSGYSSRLFQKIREQRGLAYSIYSYHGSYCDAGVWAVYAGTDKKHLNEVIEITVDEMTNLAKTMSGDELQRAKAQLKGNLILALESTSSKMTNIAKQEIYYGRYYSPEEVIKMVDAITLDEMRTLAKQLIEPDRFALTVYGPMHDGDVRYIH